MKIDDNYTQYYQERVRQKLYPTEFVVRMFLAKYPELNLKDTLSPQSKILDLGFGDGRNTGFLCELGYDVYGIEITQKIVDIVRAMLNNLSLPADLRVGRNNNIPFKDGVFDCLLACHSCYYVDDADNFGVNMASFSRVLKKDGWFVASVPMDASYIFDGSTKGPDGCFVIQNDPYGNRMGYKLRSFGSESEIKEVFADFFYDITIGSAMNNYFGIFEKVYWVACKNIRNNK